MALDQFKGGKRRDQLLDIQRSIQQQWDDAHLYEVEAPSSPSEQEKYLVTFPYPYMNGRLHIGHAFSLSKAEFAARYQRMLGKRVLFPFGFHVTGMPIKACADKLRYEMETFGYPPQFPTDEEEAPQQSVADDKVDPTKFKAQKGKLARKSSGQKYQWEIMSSLGLSDEEIKQFADPVHWCHYFPPIGIEDCKGFGLSVDWRRSFITTDINPYYDSFIRWQFKVLRGLGKVKFGKRYTIFSPKDQQPCADHDRSAGEGVVPQEYTVILLELDSLPKSLSHLESRKVSLAAATLRPETMFGQTNCWVLPGAEYGAFELSKDGPVLVMSERAAKNMAYQGLSPEFGKISRVGTVNGDDLLGLAAHAPLSAVNPIYCLPMMTISMTKGTGIVTSVPSDSPDDLMALRDLQNKAAFRDKYGITEEMVSRELVPIIEVPELGTLAAQTVCDKMKIKSQNDKEKLKLAKEEVYTRGFYSGTMVVEAEGLCLSGVKVSEAKIIVKEFLISSKQALHYSEPESLVISRSGEECVVSLTDQWYMDYGEEEWKQETLACLKKMNCFNDETAVRMEAALNWLSQWACSRTFGLGSRLPWDEQYLIESLSDSTIYMAYYTIAHLLHQGSLDGSTPGIVSPEELDDHVWDYVLLGRPYNQCCKVDEERLKALRKEFSYFYPVDLRVSGKDLITNHLTMWLYNHTAIFEQEHHPTGVRANGFLVLNNEKMSKQTGNFITLREAVEEFTSDATRFALADAGDTMEDANFVTDTANAAILKLTTFLSFIDGISNLKELKDSSVYQSHSSATDFVSFAHYAFNSAIDKAIALTKEHYESMNYRLALKTGFHDLHQARDVYRLRLGDAMDPSLLVRFIKVQTLLIAPICPHTCEYIWKEKLGYKDSVVFAPFPEISGIDWGIGVKQSELVEGLVVGIRRNLDKANRKKPKSVTRVKIFCGETYPEHFIKVLEFTRNKDMAVGSPELVKVVKQDPSLKKNMKTIMPFLTSLKEAGHSSIETVDLTSPFKESTVLSWCRDYILSNVESLEDFEVSTEDPSELSGEEKKIREVALPGSPAIYLVRS
ncbi:hypothetical protein P9112_002482 [Eukaryota sp. TZLM1-RC]